MKPKQHAQDEIKFGAVVKLKSEANKKTQTIQRVLINKKVGDKPVLQRGQDKLVFEILDVSY